MHQDDSEIRSRMVELARKHAEERGWPWRTPVEVKLTRADPKDRRWTVRTNALAVGMNVRVVVREDDFTIVESGYLAR